ncbi:MAG: AAA family ATPase [Chloroflexi bacterium]|nr:AAA family ATPase [Chloroflexota bacterium]
MAIKVGLLAQKGGVGKSTLAVGLAVAHQRTGGHAVVIDLDPQRSAAVWGQLRGGDAPPVIEGAAPQLERQVRAAERDGADLVVVDGPPRGGGGAVEAARLADLVLIPCRPSALDLNALPTALAVAAGTRSAVVLNCCPPFGSWTAEADEAVAVLGAECCPVTLGQRIAHARSFMSGRTAQELERRSAAAEEIRRLYQWSMEIST